MSDYQQYPGKRNHYNSKTPGAFVRFSLAEPDRHQGLAVQNARCDQPFLTPPDKEDNTGTHNDTQTQSRGSQEDSLSAASVYTFRSFEDWQEYLYDKEGR
jgi:hypothetical protein